MASKLKTEFNYRYQVIGDTVWEKIKTQSFLRFKLILMKKRNIIRKAKKK